MRELVGQGKPFYSALDKAAGLLRRKVGTGSEFLKELMSIPGVKQAEIAERGLGELLNAPKMTHEQFMAALGTKPAPAIHEKVLGEAPKPPSKEVLRRNANDLIRVRAREYASEGSDTSAEYRRLAAEEMQRLRSNHMDQALRLAEERATENPSSTYHGGYTLPGGDNYREMLIKAPKQPDYMNQIETAHNELRNMPYHGRTPEQEKRVGQLAKLIREIEAKTKELPEQFEGVPIHFGGEPGILASMRLKDRTGPNGEKLLHLEELQSDWHKQGREHGYKDPQAKQKLKQADELKRTFDELSKRRRILHEQALREPDAGPRFDSLMEEANGITHKLLALNSQMHDLDYFKRQQQNAIPDAPFKKNWEEMALKRLIHHAAENGYHGIVVTPGAEQADRYSLAKHVSSVMFYTDPNSDTGLLKALDLYGDPVVNKRIPVSELDSHIGKEAANKILEQPPIGVEQTGHPSQLRTLNGVDLKVGGEGMKAFYDKKVPNILNGIGKKYGVKTELHAHPIETGREEMVPDNAGLGQIRSGKPAYAQAHYFPITEAMRQDVKKNGIPLYKSGGSVPTH